MFVFAYYYKVDSMKENVGYVNANSPSDAAKLIAEIKKLSEIDVMSIFEIKKMQ